MGILQAIILEWVAMPSSRGFPSPGFEPRSPALQMDSLPSQPPGDPKNTGVGSLSLLQGIFLTWEFNQGLLPCRLILYQLNYKGRPRILEWVAYPFSRGSSWPKNWAGVSCIAREFFTSWAIRENILYLYIYSLIPSDRYHHFISSSQQYYKKDTVSLPFKRTN